MTKKFVISLSGGGIRGLLEALFLHELYKKTGKHPTEIFDMFIGCSTGAIATLLYNSPSKFTTEDIVNFYLGDDAKRIFKGKLFKLPWDTVKYPSKDIEYVLKNRLKEYKLSDCIKPCVIVTCDMGTRNVLFLNSNEECYKDYKMWECARASSAAPTFFAPYLLNNIPVIDGGLACNSPDIEGYVEAKKMFPDNDIVMVLLGTGSSITLIDYKTLNNWGYLQWACNLYEVCSDYQSDTSKFMLQKLLSDENIFTFNPKLLDGMDQMDNISDKFLTSLIGLFKEYFNNEWKDDFNRLVISIN